MSDILLAQLLEKYPPVGPHNSTQLLTYPFSEMGGKYIERIYLTINEIRFHDNDEHLITLDEIKTLANNIFDDIDYRLKINSDKDYELFFKPQDPTPYVFNYDFGMYLAKEALTKLIWQANKQTQWIKLKQ